MKTIKVELTIEELRMIRFAIATIKNVLSDTGLESYKQLLNKMYDVEKEI